MSAEQYYNDTYEVWHETNTLNTQPQAQAV
jgi:hypothetical protein